MNKNILLISQGSTFMVDAISKNLKEVGFTIINCVPTVKELKQHESDADIFLFYLGSFLDEIKDALVYLKDICIEKEKILNVIGDDSEIELLHSSINESLISNVFERPLDIKKLVATMEDVAQNSEMLNSRKNILLVDDDAAFLHMVKGWLDESYKVTIVSSGMQAITYIAKNRPDLILLDYEMPVTTGPQVLEMIRSEVGTSDIPVFFLTGKGDKESVTKVLSLKPEGYILKSAGQTQLMDQIANFFERRKGISV